MPNDPDGVDLASRSWTEVDAAGAVALLPVGSTEPHGPHLPLDTDVLISVEAARRAARRLRAEGVPAFVLPAVSYTVTEFSKDFAGAMGVTPATLHALLDDLCAAALSSGFAAMCFVNSHLEPGHLAVLREAAERAARRHGKPVIFPDKTRRRWAATLTEEFRSGACHAGQYETSLVMAVHPERVDEKVRRALPAFPVSIGLKIKEGARSFREAGGDQAYFGDPAAATAAEGDRSFEALASMVVTEVREALGR
ncbi:MAG: creatininase family protein [Candidatus Polarisedimenticolia bacterium]